MDEYGRNVVIAAFTEEQASRLTGVSQRQLRYWSDDNFFVPSLAYPGDEEGLPEMRLYSFRDLVCLKVISALRNEVKVKMSTLRSVKTHLSHLGDDLWAKTTLYVLGRKVIFVDPVTGNREDVISGQGVLQIPLRLVTGDMEQAVRAMRDRSDQNVGRIDTKTGGKKNPVIAGTRIPVKTVKAFAEAGYSISDIIKQYPSLKELDIEAAIRFREVA